MPVPDELVDDPDGLKPRASACRATTGSGAAAAAAMVGRKTPRSRRHVLGPVTLIPTTSSGTVDGDGRRHIEGGHTEVTDLPTVEEIAACARDLLDRLADKWSLLVVDCSAAAPAVHRAAAGDRRHQPADAQPHAPPAGSATGSSPAPCTPSSRPGRLRLTPLGRTAGAVEPLVAWTRARREIAARARYGTAVVPAAAPIR